jgi:hypothetical protein
MRKHWAALAAAITIGSLAACGGGGGDGDGAQVAAIDDTTPADGSTDASTASTTPEAPTDPEEAVLAFTKCMRDHGVDMPDPQVAQPATGGGKGGSAVIAVEGNPDDPTFQRANEACEPLMANARSELDDDPARRAEMEQQLLDYAQCMRDHGVDMPDPTFDDQGRVKVDMGPGGETERDTAAFDAAAEACDQGDGAPTLGAAPAGGSDQGPTEFHSSAGG